MTMQKLNSDIARVRNVAKRQAQQDFNTVQSRGIELVLHADGHKVEDFGIHINRINTTDCRNMISEAKKLAAKGHYVEFWATGGWNGADSVNALVNDDYTPWASSWDVQLEAYFNDKKELSLRVVEPKSIAPGIPSADSVNDEHDDGKPCPINAPASKLVKLEVEDVGDTHKNVTATFSDDSVRKDKLPNAAYEVMLRTLQA